MDEQDRLKQRDEQVEVIQSTLRETLERLESTSSEVCRVVYTGPHPRALLCGISLCAEWNLRGSASAAWRD